MSRGILTLLEHGRMAPTGSEFDRVMAALERLANGSAIGGGAEPEAHLSPGS